MSKTDASPNSERGSAPDYDPPGLLFTRLYWSAFGPLVALLILIGTAQEQGWLVPRDLLYVVVVVAIPLVRWLELRWARRRSDETPRVKAVEFQKYLLYVVAISAAAWIGAKILGNFILTSSGAT
jgi:hypothetical protein